MINIMYTHNNSVIMIITFHYYYESGSECVKLLKLCFCSSYSKNTMKK